MRYQSGIRTNKLVVAGGNMQRLPYVPTALFTIIILYILCLGALPVTVSAETIRINGSGAALDIMKPLIAAYKKSNPGVSIRMDKPLGSDGAKKALIAGALDIVLTSKPLKPEEIEAGARLTVYGKTPLTIVTGKNVKIRNITTRELEDIYSGTTRVWPDGEQVRIVTRPMQDVDTWILRTLSKGMEEAIDKAYHRRGAIIGITDPESSALVSGTQGSIGATGLCSVLTEYHDLNVLALNGVIPSPANLANGRYPLAKNIDFVTTPSLSAAAARFLNFVYSGKGRAIAAKKGVLVTAPCHRWK